MIQDIQDAECYTARQDIRNMTSTTAIKNMYHEELEVIVMMRLQLLKTCKSHHGRSTACFNCRSL